MTTAQESTIANTDIWSKYFRDQWSAFLNPLGVRADDPAASPVAQMAEGTAARVAGFLTLVAAGPIAWLYRDNAAQFTQIDDRGVEAPLTFHQHDAGSESVEDTAA